MSRYSHDGCWVLLNNCNQGFDFIQYTNYNRYHLLPLILIGT